VSELVKLNLKHTHNKTRKEYYHAKLKLLCWFFPPLSVTSAVSLLSWTLMSSEGKRDKGPFTVRSPPLLHSGLLCLTVCWLVRGINWFNWWCQSSGWWTSGRMIIDSLSKDSKKSGGLKYFLALKKCTEILKRKLEIIKTVLLVFPLLLSHHSNYK